jgi:SAM-dependent methyltransferase
MGEQAASANSRWAEMLSRWAIPDELVASASASPYFFEPRVFIDAADQAIARPADTPSDKAARDALPPAGSVLDVGCGAGAASLRLCPDKVVGVDSSAPLLQAFVQRANSLGIEVTAIEGRWPDVAANVAVADVVVCHHVVYNAPDLAGFAAALTEHARERVVVELTAIHSAAWMAPYWKALHGVTQPERPVAEDAMNVLAELGLDVHQQRWQRDYQMIGETGDQSLRNIARRLCLTTNRLDELRQLLAAWPPPTSREVVTFWW